MLPSADKEETDMNYPKLAQLQNAHQNVEPGRKRKMVIENILGQEWDIDYKIAAKDYLKTFKPDLIDKSALHLAFDADDFNFFNDILQTGADYLIIYKDATVIHRAVEENFDKNETRELKSRFKVDGIRSDMTTRDLHNFILMKKNVNEGDNWRLWGKLNNQFVDLILSAQVKNKNAENPRSKSGFSHFHAACLTYNREAVQLFLERGADVNESVNSDSPCYSGYAPIDFAVRCSGVEIVELLLKYRVDVEAKGKELLKVLIDQNIRILQWVNLENPLPYENAARDYVNNEKIVALLLNNVDKVDLLHLCAACTLRSTSTADNFLKTLANERIDLNSTAWAGYTALHFAAFFNMETVKLLLKNGADIEAKNENGITPFDVLVTRASIKDIHYILTTKDEWKDITLSDGKTRLLDLISSMENSSTFDNFLNTIDVNSFVCIDSLLWPGHTILHLTVLFSETAMREQFLDNVDNSKINCDNEFTKYRQVQEKAHLERIKICLRRSVKIDAQDVQGRTPIHLAFRQRKLYAAKLLLQHLKNYKNIVDQDNLSLLHIACAVRCKESVEKLASTENLDIRVSSSFKWDTDFYNSISKDIFEIAGSTALHIAVSEEVIDIISIVAKNTTVIYAKDANSMTPIDRVSSLKDIWNVGNDIFSWFGPDDTLEKSIFNLHKNFEFDAYRDATLNFYNIRLVLNSICEVEEDFIRRSPSTVLLDSYDGGDILARREDGSVFLFELLENHGYKTSNFLREKLKEEKTVERIQEEFGLTILHVACHYCDVDLAKDSLSIGINVNAQINNESPFYAGSTALHLLMVTLHLHGRSSYYAKNGEIIVRMLLDAGADACAVDARNSTPLHHRGYSTATFRQIEAKQLACYKILPEHIRNFNFNPINELGLSIFHMACIENDFHVITEFLKHKIDVNQPVDLFSSSEYRGWSPLHLVLKNPVDVEKQLQTIELLLDHGADINSENNFGDTPLHLAVAVKTRQLQLIELLIRKGANLHAENVYGKPPFELLLESREASRKEIETFLNCGCRLNTFNRVSQVGYMALLLNCRIDGNTKNSVKIAMNHLSANEVDDMGRTILHNIVSCGTLPNMDVIERVVRLGIDVNHQDLSGRTALHATTQFNNYKVIETLISHGADVDAVDVNGQTAFAYALNPEKCLVYPYCDVIFFQKKYMFQVLVKCVYVMQLYGAYVSEINRRCKDRAINELHVDLGEYAFKVDINEINESFKNVRYERIGTTTFKLDDFMSETSAIVAYPRMSLEVREQIDRFFETTIAEPRFKGWRFMCKLQYRKAQERSQLVELAKGAMNIVLGFPLPDLCFDIVQKYLGNADLKNVIIASGS